MKPIRKDILWKGIIEDFFSDFLIFFYPESQNIFDFTKGFEFLDKELEQIILPSSSKNRIADKLVKVYTKEGKEQWILVHIEVQGYEDDEFSERMFTYFYRIYDKYKKDISALAIFTDDNPKFHPKNFKKSFLKTSVIYTYETFKLSQYKPEDFQSGNNPFSVVMETALYGLKKNKLTDEKLFLVKLDLARRLNAKGFSTETFGKLCSFIKTYVSFDNSKLLPKLDTEIDTFNKIVRPMGIIEAIQEERIRQATEEVTDIVTKQVTKKVTKQVTEQVTQQVTQNILKGNIQKLYNRGFTVEVISEMLEIPLEFVIESVK
jgi:hypothetical protein